MDIDPCVYFFLTKFSMNVMNYLILDAMNALSFLPFCNSLIYWSRSLVVETVSTEIFISRWSLIILLWKPSSCSNFLDDKVANSDCTSTFVPPIWGPIVCRSLDRIVHPNISLSWLVETLYIWGTMEDLMQVAFGLFTKI